jgi:glycosyltransferase involved in cell wall biosynthesis
MPEPVEVRVGLQQRVLPAYRAPFFERLAAVLPNGLGVFAGQPLPQEQIPQAERLQGAHWVPAANRNLFDPSSSLYLCWQPGLLAWLADWDPGLLVVEANPRYPSTRQAIRWMHARRRPVIGWGLGAPPLSGLLAGPRRAERQNLLDTLDGMLAYSRRGAEEYRALGFPPERVFVASNAALPRPSWPAPQRPDYLQKKPLILFVGRLQARKRLDLLFEACAALPQELQPQVVVVGDGPARPDFEAAARRSYPQVTFAGEQRGPALEPYFREADLFVLPGTGGLAVQQAMAYALPVIVARGDGTQEDLVQPGSGWLIPADDRQALVSSLAEALDDIPRLRRMGQAAYRVVAEQINVDQMASAFLGAIHSILKQGLR